MCVCMNLYINLNLTIHRCVGGGGLLVFFKQIEIFGMDL